MGLLFLVIIIGLLLHQGIQDYKTMKIITSIEPQDVIMFKVYSPNDPSGKHPFNFTIPDPIIHDFFQSLKDQSLYFPTHDTVDSQDHTWFLDVGTKESLFQISFHIPSGKGRLVAGHVERIYDGSMMNYSDFQSRKLFDWYQTYKDRWLTPAAPPGATAAPTPP